MKPIAITAGTDTCDYYIGLAQKEADDGKTRCGNGWCFIDGKFMPMPSMGHGDPTNFPPMEPGPVILPNGFGP